MSRNSDTGTYVTTEEELLLELVSQLTDYLEDDLARGLDAVDEDDLELLYPRFCDAVKKMAERFKDSDSRNRRLCSVPSFVLGLAMAGRGGRHYKHSSWFTAAHLGQMLGTFGGVSELEC